MGEQRQGSTCVQGAMACAPGSLRSVRCSSLKASSYSNTFTTLSVSASAALKATRRVEPSASGMMR